MLNKCLISIDPYTNITALFKFMHSKKILARQTSLAFSLIFYYNNNNYYNDSRVNSANYFGLSVYCVIFLFLYLQSMPKIYYCIINLSFCCLPRVISSVLVILLKLQRENFNATILSNCRRS